MHLRSAALQKRRSNATRPRPPYASTTSAPLRSAMQNLSYCDINDDEFDAFRQLIYRETGISLNNGKRALVCSRLSKRLRALQLDTFLDYYAYLLRNDTDGVELQQMINCITTNKTEFFREPHHFDFLRTTIFPEAQARATHGGTRRLRVWSAGCSMGHEPYSLAITLLEAMGAARGWDIRILASDIDTNVLDIASRGVYDLDELQSIPEDLKRKYFLRGTGRWEGTALIRPAVQRLITFRRINLTEDAWPIQTQFDLILCRNVIIYFNQATQQRLFEHFRQHLKTGSHLMLGHSENMPSTPLGYRSLGGTIYRYESRGL